MDAQIIESRAAGHFDGMLERPERAMETLRALRLSGYRSEGERETIGEGILLHHDSGPDLVLYPDGSLHPVGLYQQGTGSQVAPQIRPKRSFVRLVRKTLKWTALIALVGSAWMLSLALWAAILEGL